MYYLQIKKGEYYEALALGQQISFREMQGERGGIFFRDEKTPLAQTKIKNIVYIFPKKIKYEYQDNVAEILSKILKEKKQNLISLFEKGEIIKREVSDEILEETKSVNLKGVVFDKVWTRVYPQNELGAHIVGFLSFEDKGQYGIEGYYDKDLQGKREFKQKEKSPFGYLPLSFWEDNKIISKGADLFLTLDYKIQYFAEKLLLQAKESWDIDSGQIVVSNPQTGEILALAVFPSFNPNSYQKQNLETFLNPIVQKLFEPGSIFKAITFAAAIEEQLITPETTYIDEGFVKIIGSPIYNFRKKVWGEQTMTDVLEESINTGAVFVQQKLGQELFLDYLEKFGFFEKTKIDLQTEAFSENKILKQAHPRALAVASFGQGIEITPIQMIRAFSAIANQGNLMRPFLIKKIIRSNNEINEIYPEVQKKVFSNKTANDLTLMLISVVDNGSGKKAKIPGYFIAGKTGTAQIPLKQGGYSETETIQSFISFFPALDPKFLVFVKLDNPKEVNAASKSAVPLAHEMIKYIIDSQQIPPDYNLDKIKN